LLAEEEDPVQEAPMAEVTFSRNEFEPRYPELADQFEEELRHVLAAIPGAPLSVQVRVEAAFDGALERAWVVVVHADWIREWALQLPVAEGDVRRSAVRAFSERRREERREGARTRQPGGTRREPHAV
jgi:hypothetical protein